GFEIAANVFWTVGRRGREVCIIDAPVGQESAELEGAQAVELAIARFDGRKRSRVEMRDEGGVAVRRHPTVIWEGDLKPVAVRHADLGYEPAGNAPGFAASADAENRQEREGQAE